jgi:cytoskeletal protein CcmA (bactofilin family)
MHADTLRTLRTVATPAAVVMSLAAISAGPVRAIEFCSADDNAAFAIAVGETREGDLYTAGKSIDIDGTLNGDLIGAARNIRVTGEVTGDMFLGAEVITIKGRVGDSVRAAGNTVIVQGIVDGDLLVFAEKLTIESGAVVTGDVFAMVASATVEGRVEGDYGGGAARLFVSRTGSIRGNVDGTMAEFDLRGAVEGDVRITTDTLSIDPGARIGGDLIYTSRHVMEQLEGMDVVTGDIEFTEKVVDEDDQDDDDGFSMGSVAWKLGWVACSFLVGSILIAIFRRQVPGVERAIRREPLQSLGVGFVLGLVLPVSAVILMLGVVTIPLSVIAIVLSLVGWYVAKVPVAVWIGRRVLTAAGMTDPSPYLGLIIGLVPLYILFALPYLVGLFAYWATIFLGLGSIYLGVREQPEPAGA